jgi:hypothetical protein
MTGRLELISQIQQGHPSDGPLLCFPRPTGDGVTLTQEITAHLAEPTRLNWCSHTNPIEGNGPPVGSLQIKSSSVRLLQAERLAAEGWTPNTAHHRLARIARPCGCHLECRTSLSHGKLNSHQSNTTQKVRKACKLGSRLLKQFIWLLTTFGKQAIQS